MPSPRAGPFRFLVLMGRKGRFALWMNPLAFVLANVLVWAVECVVMPRTFARATPTPSGWDLTKLSHDLSQALPCCIAHSTNSPDSDATALAVERQMAT